MDLVDDAISQTERALACLKEATQEIAALEQELARVRSEVEARTEENERLVKERDELKEKIDALEKEAEGLETKLSEKEAEVSKWLGRVVDLIDKKSRLYEAVVVARDYFHPNLQAYTPEEISAKMTAAANAHAEDPREDGRVSIWLKPDSWQNLFAVIRSRETHIDSVGNFWAAVQEAERQLAEQTRD